MKFDLDQVLTDLDDEPLNEPGKVDPPVPFTMRRAIRMALISPQAGPPIPAAESVQRYDLQQAVAAPGLVELTAPNIVLIEQSLAQNYGPLVVGQIHHALNKPVAEKA